MLSTDVIFLFRTHLYKFYWEFPYGFMTKILCRENCSLFKTKKMSSLFIYFEYFAFVYFKRREFLYVIYKNKKYWTFACYACDQDVKLRRQ